MAESDHKFAQVGVVAIGRNEGPRLERCLRSAVGQAAAVVYVDSGSSDGSVAFAGEHGVDVVQLDISDGFTAARARNAGLRRLLEIAPAAAYVQFVDGDCELADGWMAAAVGFLTEHPDFAVVCGRRREVEPQKNVFHAVTDIEWDTPVGESKYCGGDALMRIEALQAVGGYRDTLIAGEEPELCVRLRQRAWRIFRLDHDMSLHDIRMSGWRQWWRRSVRAGYAYAEGAALHGRPPERHWVKERRSIFMWGAAMPLCAACLAWQFGAISFGGLAAAYAVLAAKAAWTTHCRGIVPPLQALCYGMHCAASKAPQLWGATQFLWPWKQCRIIEYKAAPAARGSLRS